MILETCGRGVSRVAASKVGIDGPQVDSWTGRNLIAGFLSEACIINPFAVWGEGAKWGPKALWQPDQAAAAARGNRRLALVGCGGAAGRDGRVMRVGAPAGLRLGQGARLHLGPVDFQRLTVAVV